jgi:hypothetical protein
MSWTLIFENLVAYSLQIGMLVGVAAAIPSLAAAAPAGCQAGVLAGAAGGLPAAAAAAVETGRRHRHGADYYRDDGRTASPSRVVQVHRATRRNGAAAPVNWSGHPAGLAGRGLLEIAPLPPPSRPLDPAPAWSVEAALLVSDDIASPVTFGWRKPVVLLPAHFPELDARVQDAILCHEIMHVRRGDWLFTVAEEMVRAIFWFHPAIWWLLGEIGLAREQEVDRLAIEITHEREHYMDALLAIAGAGAQLDLAPAPLFLRKRHLRHRVILILQEARYVENTFDLDAYYRARRAGGGLLAGHRSVSADRRAADGE